ncbi:MAG: M20/M25/M40 family metallo-hydrolase [Firmicutes bacterium]|jgi:acetylornithine deacetylase/succinyl-diaminopimelate desuccinylase-like protein|nr:M20/M25/M40 family metallo-hydrolase [Bacillota bacterium]
MSYKVDEIIKEHLSNWRQYPEIVKGFEFLHADAENTLKQQMELVLVEAPTFEEEERAQVFAQMLKEAGLDNVIIDEDGNTFGILKGKGEGPTILLEAHLDTVFPKGTVKEIVHKDGRIYCPGINDDTRGLANVLAILRAIKHAQIETTGDIIFLGTVEEEGIGGFGGMKKFLAKHQEVDGSISIDGAGLNGIVYEATGIRTIAVTFKGIGGHAMGAFGHVANPLHAAARAVAKIADIEVPADPRTTYAVSNFHAGNDTGVHAIVKDATIKINFRSNGQKELEELEAKIIAAIEEACQEETERWGKDTITYELIDYVDNRAGTQDKNAPIVQAAFHLIESLGFEPRLAQGGSTNASIPVTLGIPGVTLGRGGSEGGVHTVNEWFDPTDAHKGLQVIYLLLLHLAGVENKITSILII